MPLGSPSARPVVVTGASSGIGREIARKLVELGYPVTLISRSQDKLRDLADELRRLRDVPVDIVPCDLADADARGELIERLSAGAVAGLCNCAGFGTSGRFHDMPMPRESEEIILNVLALAELTHAVLPGMVARKEGAVLNVASLAAFQPLPGMATYSATKAFVLYLSRAVNEELRDTNVSCTALCPGPVPTEWAKIAGVQDIPKIMETSVSTVASAAVASMHEGKDVVVPGLTPKVMAALTALLPDKLLIRTMSSSL